MPGDGIPVVARQSDATGPPIWHLLTGEYPPQIGGVSDYTMVLAGALAAAGAEIHVWATALAATGPGFGGAVTVHRIAGRRSSADLSRLGAVLDAFAPPRRLLIQHVPNAWGDKGPNLGFGRWLAGRRRQGDDVRVMFHKVRYFTRLCDRPTRSASRRRPAAGWSGALDASVARLCFDSVHWDKLLRSHDPYH